MKRLMIATGFVALALIGHAQAAFDGRWLCIEEFGGGIAYDAPAKSWAGTRFTPTKKFVMSVQYQSSGKSDMLDLDYYKVTISDFGSKEPMECLGVDGPVSTITGMGIFACKRVLTDYHVNLTNGRYFSVYAVGYTSGKDADSDTPAIMGGTCARFD